MQDYLLSVFNNTHILYSTFAIISFSIVYYIYQSQKTLPGPLGLPFLGYYPFLDYFTCHLQLHEFGKKYGEVFGFNVMGKTLINLGSVKAMREAFVSKTEYFAKKPEEYSILYTILGKGVVFLNGEAWKVTRKFIMQQFRERGMTTINEALSGPLYDSILQLVKDLNEMKGASVHINTLLLARCSGTIRESLLGIDGITEQEFSSFIQAFLDMLTATANKTLLLHGKFAKYFILPFEKGFREAKKPVALMQDILQIAVDRRRESFDETNIRDVVDAYLKERKYRISKNDPTAEYFSDKHLVDSLLQILGDGSTTIAYFIGEFIKALLQHPEEQDKIYNEMIEVIGPDRDPCLEDKNKLSYTNAFIYEVIRTSQLFSFFPSLECTKETTVCGRKIPKGAITIYNFWSAHMNTEEYENPEKFNPSRFIVEEGKKRPELPVPFGLGKRACLGEGFTMNQVFLFLTTIIKNFKISESEETGTSSKMFNSTIDLLVCAYPRH